MMEKKDIHYSKKRVERGIERLNSVKTISDNDKKAILRFIDKCFARGLSSATIANLLDNLRLFSTMLGKDFERTSREDIERVIKNIEISRYSESTKRLRKVAIKQFYRCLKGNDEEYPVEVKWIKVRPRTRDHRLPAQLLTKEDIRKMVDVAEPLRDKALISTLYESGCRVGELLTLSIKNVSFDDCGAKLMVDGKTGMRRLRIVSSTPDIVAWLDNHPFKDEPDAPLWVTIGVTNPNEQLGYNGVKQLLSKIARKAGIKKDVNPHNFRHSRATYLANHLTEAQLKEYLGWVQDSRMVGTYVHLSGRDTDNALLKLYGLKKEEEKESVLKSEVWSRSETVDSPGPDFCKKCDLVRNPETVLNMDENVKRSSELMTILMKDRKARDFITKRINALGLQEKLFRLVK